MLEFIKNHYGKISIGTIATVLFTIGGYWFSDIRYAHAKDVRKNQEEVRIEIDKLKEEIKKLQK